MLRFFGFLLALGSLLQKVNRCVIVRRSRQADNGLGGAGLFPDWGDVAIALCVAGAAFCIYVATLAPGLLRGDAGQFQTLAVTQGYARPIGAPVYVLLARLATMLPLGEVAYRVNLLSAIGGAAAAAVAYLLGRSLLGWRWISLAGAAALALSPTFWSRAVVAGLFPLSIASTLAVFFCLSAWHASRRSRWLTLAFCLACVSLGVHAGIVLTLPGILLVVLLTHRRWFVNGIAILLGMAAGLALALAAFVEIDAADSPSSYFHAAVEPSRSLWNLAPENLDEFPERLRFHLTAPPYRAALFSQPAAMTRHKAFDYVANLPREFPPLWLALAIVGVFRLGRATWQITLALLLSHAAHLTFALTFDSPDAHLLYLTTYVPLVVFGMAGLALVAEGWVAFARWRGVAGRSPAALDLILGLLGLLVVVSPLFFTAAWNVEGRRACWVPLEKGPFRVDDSGRFHRRIRRLVDDLEDNAVVFLDWPRLYPCYYVAHVEQGRTGMSFFHDYPEPNHYRLADSALKHLARLVPDRPVYFTHEVDRVAAWYRLEPVQRGGQTVYLVTEPIRAQPDAT